MYQDNLKRETIEFLKKYVYYPKSRFSLITNDNADDIVEFITDNYITPLVQDQEEGKRIDTQLLKDADNAIDDICEN